MRFVNKKKIYVYIERDAVYVLIEQALRRVSPRSGRVIDKIIYTASTTTMIGDWVLCGGGAVSSQSAKNIQSTYVYI